MNDIVTTLYNAVRSEMLNWNENGIYAISFFVYSNEAYRYKSFSMVTFWMP